MERDDSLVIQRVELACPVGAVPWVDMASLHRAGFLSQEGILLSLLAHAPEGPNGGTLTRIGSSVFHLARWSWVAPGVVGIAVVHPLTRETFRFRVLEASPPLGVVHRRVAQAASTEQRVQWAAGGPHVTFHVVATTAVRKDADVLAAVSRAWGDEPMPLWIQALARTVLSAVKGRRAPPAVMVEGPEGCGKSSLVRRLMKATTSVVGPSRRVAVRWVDVAKAMEQSRHTTDAAAVLVAALVLRSENVGDRGDDAGEKPLHLVVFDNVELLSSTSEEPFVTVAVHALAQHLEEASACRDRPLVVAISTPQPHLELHPALRARHALQGTTISATMPEASWREHWIRRCLLQRGLMDYSDIDVNRAVESSAGWSAARLQRDSDVLLSDLRRLHAAGVGLESRSSSLLACASFRRLVAVDSAIGIIQKYLLTPLLCRQQLLEAGVMQPKGALITGPSGTGKTALLAATHDALIALRQSAALRVNVMSVDALTLLHKEVGRSEKQIHALMDDARASAPTVLFLDNLDALAPPRGRVSTETNVTADRTLSSLLVEFDGVRSTENRPVVVIASAPSVDSLDAAMTRPGRLDLHITLSLPSSESVARAVVARLQPEWCRKLITVTQAQNAEWWSDEQLLEYLVQQLSQAAAAIAMERGFHTLSFADADAAARELALLICSSSDVVVVEEGGAAIQFASPLVRALITRLRNKR